MDIEPTPRADPAAKPQPPERRGAAPTGAPVDFPAALLALAGAPATDAAGEGAPAPAEPAALEEKEEGETPPAPDSAVPDLALLLAQSGLASAGASMVPPPVQKAEGLPASTRPPGLSRAPGVGSVEADETFTPAGAASAPRIAPGLMASARARTTAPSESAVAAATTARGSAAHVAANVPRDPPLPPWQAAAAMPPVLPVAADAGMLWRRIERPTEHAPGARAAVAVPGADLQGGASFLLPPVAPPSAAADASSAGLAQRMVEQVGWWLSQKTQGAELAFDVAGGGSVSVSVQVQGNEAHVAFRTDDALARQLLGDAMPQLENLLGAGGLTLGGVTVGNAGPGRDQAPAQPPAPSPASAEGKGTAAVGAPEPLAGVPRRAAGRAIDLYV